MSEVFISYSSKDADYAAALAQTLENHSITVWLAQGKMTPGEDWFQRMTKEVVGCQIVIVLLSKAALKSRWVELEYQIAIGLNKPIIPLRLKKKVNIPKYLKRYQTLSDSATVVSEIIDKINQMKVESEMNYMNVSSRIWHDLLAETLGIGIRIYDNKDEGDTVNVATLLGALNLQQALLMQLNLYLNQQEDLTIIPINDNCAELKAVDKNLVLLGGPGGFPCVASLLEAWTDPCKGEAFRGYRFVTHRFKASRYLRHSTDPEDGNRAINDLLGIEDIQPGEEPQIYAAKAATNFSVGDNYGVIFTKGLGKDSSGQKIVIVAPYNRSALDGMLRFLTHKPAKCDAWLEKVRQCGDCSETLFHLRAVQGSGTEYFAHTDPRPMACCI